MWSWCWQAHWRKFIVNTWDRSRTCCQHLWSPWRTKVEVFQTTSRFMHVGHTCKNTSYQLSSKVEQSILTEKGIVRPESNNEPCCQEKRFLNDCSVWHTLDTIFSDIPMAPLTTVIVSLIKAHMRDASSWETLQSVPLSTQDRSQCLSSNDCDLYPSGPGGQNKPQNHNNTAALALVP